MKHPFDSAYIGKPNPYDGTTVSTEEDYYRYLREHTYHLLCEEAADRTVKKLWAKQCEETASIRSRNEALSSELSKHKTARRRLRIVSLVLLILLLSSFVTASALRSSGGTYEDGYAAGRSAQESADADLYGDGYAAGKDAGYNEGYREGYWEGYADAGERSTGTGDSHGSGTGTHTGTGPTRDTAIANTYIGNTSSKKFHLPTCSYLPDAANQITFDSRDEAIAAGYEPCGHCHP